MADQIATSGGPADESLYDGPPYVGPEPFKQEQERIFCGRDREKNDLCSLIAANSEVLLHAQSGAGKSSLLNAGVIPELKRRPFTIRAVTRVRIQETNLYSLGKIENVFMFNALSAWIEDPKRDFDRIARVRLADFLGLEKLPERKAEKRKTEESLVEPEAEEAPPEGLVVERKLPELLIFDQLEEIFEIWPERWTEREDFFSQIGEALKRGEHLRILFAIREDYLARLFPCLEALPRRMKVRFRLEPLDKRSAVHAVVDPLSRIADPRPTFAAGVAEKLVENLSPVKARDLDGKVREVSGKFVEPLQLAVVCRDLWDKLPTKGMEIGEEAIKDYGNVDDALAAYYKTCLDKAAKTGVREMKLRAFFKKQLITEEGTRSTVYRGTDTTGGLPNAAVEILKESHIIRHEERAGGGWYELSHDRFIGPIQQSNEEWLAKQGPSPQTKVRLTELLKIWKESGNDKKNLLKEADLKYAKKWVQSAEPDGFGCPEDLPDFVVNSELGAVTRKAAKWRLAIIPILGALLTLIPAAVVFWLSGRKYESEELADRARFQWETKSTRRLLLGLQSVGLNKSPSSIGALDEALQAAILSQSLKTAADITSVSFDAVPNRFATVGSDGRIQIWDSTSAYVRQGLPDANSLGEQPPQAKASGAVYDPLQGEHVTRTTDSLDAGVVNQKSACKSPASDDSEKPIWKLGLIRPLLTLESEKSPPLFVGAALTPDGRYVVTRETVTLDIVKRKKSSPMRLWDLAKQCQVWESSDYGDGGILAEFSPDGKMLATSDENGTIRIWTFDSQSKQPSLHPHSSLNCAGREAQSCGGACDTAGIRSISWSKDGMLAAADSREVALWDVSNKKCVGSVNPFEGRPSNGDVLSVVKLSQDGKSAAIGSSFGIVQVWDLGKTDKPHDTFKSLESLISALAFNERGTFLAAASLNGAATVWNTDNKAPAIVITRKEKYTTLEMKFSPDDTYLTAVHVNRQVSEHSLDVGNSRRLAADTALGDSTMEEEFPVYTSRKCMVLFKLNIDKRMQNIQKYIRSNDQLKSIRDGLLDDAVKDCEALKPTGQ